MAGRGPHPRTRLRRGVEGFPRGSRCRQADHRARRQAGRGASPPSTPEYSASPAPLTPKVAVVVSTARLLAVRVGARRCPLRSEWIVSSRCRAVRRPNVACRSWYVSGYVLHVACCASAVACCMLHAYNGLLQPAVRVERADRRRCCGRHAIKACRRDPARAHTRTRRLTHAHAPTRARTRNGPLPRARALAPQTPLLLRAESFGLTQKAPLPARAPLSRAVERRSCMRTSCTGASQAEPSRAKPSRAAPSRAERVHTRMHSRKHTHARARAASTHAYAYAGCDCRRRRRNSEPRIDRDAIHSQPISPRCPRRNDAAMQRCNKRYNDAVMQRYSGPTRACDACDTRRCRGTLCASAFHPAASASTVNAETPQAIANNTDQWGGARGRALHDVPRMSGCRAAGATPTPSSTLSRCPCRPRRAKRSATAPTRPRHAQTRPSPAPPAPRLPSPHGSKRCEARSIAAAKVAHAAECGRASSAPGLGSPLPHLRRDWPHPCRHARHTAPGLGSSSTHILMETWLARSSRALPGLGHPALPADGRRRAVAPAERAQPAHATRRVPLRAAVRPVHADAARCPRLHARSACAISVSVNASSTDSSTALRCAARVCL